MRMLHTMPLKRTTVHLHPRQQRDLKRLGKWYERTPAELIRFAIDEYLTDRLGAGKMKMPQAGSKRPYAESQP